MMSKKRKTTAIKVLCTVYLYEWNISSSLLLLFVMEVENNDGQSTPTNRSAHFNLQQNNFKFISFSFTWIPYNKNTAEFWRESWIFFSDWLIIIINTNMYTSSYTINTALSKGVESITRHHSPLTTEYISFQHIYKNYNEREEEQKEVWDEVEERKPCASTLPELKDPDF